ncbi:MAG: DUF333 domain-containing protein [Nanoarchaeota archaeon]|nr:DUF333 domain-containing protein [Nanoarchaeota archaeon]MBU1004266.1 DUF333 domain-containing protein [Nanoarchaeota archaeon]MBU1946143.1 DUF333 domain-containing protein [Nanoarchaeota archaeon]
MKKGLSFVLLLVVLAAGCNQAPVKDNTQIANPASVNCIEKGGKLDIRENPQGQYGVCILPDGSECEEWAFYRGECSKTPVNANADCSSDSDCVIGGCSGTICLSKNSELMFTTCEWTEEYGCYKQIDCGCVSGKCDWKKTADFDNCVEEARKPDIGIVRV